MGSQTDWIPRAWRRHPKPASHLSNLIKKTHTFEETFESRSPENVELDVQTKLSALRVSPSVISLVSHLGDETLFVASGTIVECEASEMYGNFTCLVLTSATLLRGRLEVHTSFSLDHLKVIAYLYDGSSCEAEVVAFDLHFNVCIIRINTKEVQQTTLIRCLGGSTLVSDSQVLRRHSDINLAEKVIALGRHYRAHDLMVASGVRCVDRCELECEELEMTTCQISLGGIGGPLINYDGEVIGINFYHSFYTPFLPMNIVCRCLELLKVNRSIPRFRLGLQAISLCEVTVSLLEIIVQRFPTINEGVVIEKVLVGSLAEAAGIQPYDIIVECHLMPVRCPSELYGILLDNADEELEIVVMRPSDGNLLKLKLVADTSTDLYRWPIPKPRRARIEY